jgi:hypothetical protein
VILMAASLVGWQAGRQDFLSPFGFGAGASRTSRGGGSIC